MPSAPPTLLIDIDALRLGMFVHLELGWLEHPFPRSQFELTSTGQIDTLRLLGLRQVRVRADSIGIDGDDATDAALSNPADGDDRARGQGEHTIRRSALTAERRSLQQCERRFASAARDWKQICADAIAEPNAAHSRARSLVDALVGDLTQGESAHIRLLSESAGDLASQHGVNVTVLALMLGRFLGMKEAELADLGVGALLHDLGKLELPAAVRHPDEHLNAAQSQLYRDHVAHGIRLGVRMGLSSQALLVIAQHHEAVDGSGFPKGLRQDHIALAARIVALVNRYDNLCNPPVAAAAMTPHEALTHLYAQMKPQFDANAVHGFIRLMGVYPPGSVIQLTDERFALVVRVNPDQPLRPQVLVHDPKVPRDEAAVLDLLTVRSLGIRRSLHPQHLPRAALDYLSPRQRMCYFFERSTHASVEEAA